MMNLFEVISPFSGSLNEFDNKNIVFVRTTISGPHVRHLYNHNEREPKSLCIHHIADIIADLSSKAGEETSSSIKHMSFLWNFI